MRTRLEVSRARGFSRFVGRGDEMAALEAALAGRSQAMPRSSAWSPSPGSARAASASSSSSAAARAGSRLRGARRRAREGDPLPSDPGALSRASSASPSRTATRPRARRSPAGCCCSTSAARRAAAHVRFPRRSRSRAPRSADRSRGAAAAALRDRQARGPGAEPPRAGGPPARGSALVRRRQRGVLELLVEAAAATRTLLVLNFRPEYHARWMQKSYYQQLPLLPLGPEAIAELLARSPRHRSVARRARRRDP